jgi:hypothetical protein
MKYDAGLDMRGKHIATIPVKESLINPGSLVGYRSPLLTFVTE